MIFGDKDTFAIEAASLDKLYTIVFLYINGQIVGKANEETHLSAFSRSLEQMYEANGLPDFLAGLSDADKINAACGKNKNLTEEQYDTAFRLMYASFGDTFDRFILLRYREGGRIVFLWKKWEYARQRKYLKGRHKRGKMKRGLFRAEVDFDFVRQTVIEFKTAFFKESYQKTYQPPEIVR